MEFKLHSKYKPTGDQPQAIEQLVKGFKEGNQFETLLGVTGSGKTFTMANVIAALNKPTLIISHNKTLAGQLYGEMKEFFPENAVEYFVSYYDYYQPEAYVPQSGTYIAKDSSVNDEIDKLRLSATAALTERKDVIVVASVSCIYGLGSPDEWTGMSISLRPGQERDRDDLARSLIDLQYTRNDMDFHRGTFRVHGDVLDIFPANADDTAIRVEFFGDEIDRIVEVDVLTGEVKCSLEHTMIFPASHYVVSQEKINEACLNIEKELDAYLERYSREVCTEYLLILNQMGQLPFTIKRVGTWIGKTGRIDIVAQSEDRRSIIGFCNWDKPVMTMDMCENMAMAMDQARLTSDDYYLFSATDFEPALQSYVVRDPRFKLINMNEL